MPLSSFVIAALALNLAPGPDMTYVAARSLAQGRRAGVVSALGIAVGCIFHIMAAALGVAVLLEAVPQAYTVVRLVGAAYLVYLGVGLIRRAALAENGAIVAPASDWVIFQQGVVTNVLNPKVALFFLAFLPQFIDPARGPAGLQTLGLGLFFNAQGTIVNVLVACLAGSVRSALQSGRRVAWMQRVSGAVLVALGLRLALARSNG
jgi:threonine/homoserine/homoserine lactone efflux protein